MTSTFERYVERLAATRWAATRGLGVDSVVAEIRRLDDAVRAVAGSGFDVTPFSSQPRLAEALGAPVELWVKDETVNPGGSHKGRHLFGVALHHALEARAGLPVEAPYAVASCGNAALAAATVARAVDHALHVFVPDWADEAVVEEIEALGASVLRCARDEHRSGDPSHHAMVEAIAGGAVGFSCQGSDTPTTIDGARTMAWEMVDVLADHGDEPSGALLDRIVIQVGGGALATAVVTGLASCSGVVMPTVHVVQPEGNHPLVRAWDRLASELIDDAPPTTNVERADAALQIGGVGDGQVRAIVRRLGANPGRYMEPWPTEPESYATGILDDVAYDWIPVIEAMLRTGGHPLVATDDHLRHAHGCARSHTSIDVSPTGAAGLGGLVAGLDDGSIVAGVGERVAVLFTGRQRRGDPRPS